MSNTTQVTTTTSPGEKIGHVSDFIPGEGTFVHKQHIHSSLLGMKVTVSVEGSQKVVRKKETAIVPKKGNVILGKVTKVNPRFASVVVYAVDNQPVPEPFNGIIRVQDIRAYDVDKIEVYKCFRPEDVVRAEVLSLGDARSYYLSTAKNELGVISAKSVAGATMVPISWQEMQCPKSKMKEFRKVAKIEVTDES